MLSADNESQDQTVVMYRFYSPFKNISLILSGLLIRGGLEKNHLTNECRTWHLICVPSEARTTVVRDTMLKSQLLTTGPQRPVYVQDGLILH